MPNFLVLPIEKPDTFQAMSPKQMQQIVDKYVRWTQSLARKKRLVSGENSSMVTGASCEGLART